MDLRQAVGGQTWRRVQPLAPPRARAHVHGFPHSVSSTLPTRTSARIAATCSSAAVGSLVSTTTAAEQAAALFEDHASRRSAKLAEACSICPAVLQTRLSKAHSSAVSAALVVQDTLGKKRALTRQPGFCIADDATPATCADEKLVVTASLDKGVAAWRFYTVSALIATVGNLHQRQAKTGSPVERLGSRGAIMVHG